MEIRITTRNSRVYVSEIIGVLQTERDVVDLIGLCGARNADRLLILPVNLPELFFDLKSGLAGLIFQKFINYHLKVALVVPAERIKGRFKELALEASGSQHFHIFPEVETALNWLVGEVTP